MSTTAFELMVLPTCLAVFLGAIVGYCLATLLRGADPRFAAQADRLMNRDRLPSTLVLERDRAAMKPDPPAEAPRRDDPGESGPRRSPIARDRDDEMGFPPSRSASGAWARPWM